MVWILKSVSDVKKNNQEQYPVKKGEDKVTMTKFVKGQPRPEGAGRQKGSINKVTRETREVIQELIDGNSGNLEGWLEKVAQDDPAKAIELCLKMMEYILPKLSRTEHSGGVAHLSLESVLANVMGKTTGLPDPAWFDVVDNARGEREKPEIINV